MLSSYQANVEIQFVQQQLLVHKTLLVISKLSNIAHVETYMYTRAQILIFSFSFYACPEN